MSNFLRKASSSIRNEVYRHRSQQQHGRCRKRQTVQYSYYSSNTMQQQQQQQQHRDSQLPPNPHKVLSSPKQLQSRVDQLLDWFENKTSVLALTGAGLSTNSGISDYRGHLGCYHRGYQPVVHDRFMKHEQQHQRFWGKEWLGGGPYFQPKKLNIGHSALTQLERVGKLGVEVAPSSSTVSIITQNVDSLHLQAETRDVVELHGRASHLRCMSCGACMGRDEFQTRLRRLNEEWLSSPKRKNLETFWYHTVQSAAAARHEQLTTKLSEGLSSLMLFSMEMPSPRIAPPSVTLL